MKNDAAFSGLEAAIVLIAFVVVAAVFSYVMLGAGFFATSKAQEVTYSGIKQTTSNAVLDGYLYGSYATSNGLTALTFYIKIPEGGETIQLSQLSYLYGKNNQVSAPVTPSTGSSGSLSPGDRTKIIIGGTTSLSGPKAGSVFSLEIKPRVGASTLIQRTLSSGYTGGVIY
jgi:archaeal flagellin FlaB